MRVKKNNVLIFILFICLSYWYLFIKIKFLQLFSSDRYEQFLIFPQIRTGCWIIRWQFAMKNGRL